MASLLWDRFDLHAGCTEDYRFKLYKADGKTAAALAAGDVVRFKLAAKAGEAPKLDIDSVAATAAGSVVTIITIGADGVTPAEVNVRIGQDDTKDLTPGEYHGFLGIADDSETDPADAFKVAGRGPILLKPPPKGDVGLA